MSLVASFRFHPLGEVRLSLVDVQAVPGAGSASLGFTMEVTSAWLQSDDPQSVAQMLLAGSVLAQDPHRRIGALHSQVISLRGFPVRETLLIDLTPDQIVAVEQQRGEGDLRLQLDLHVTLLAAPSEVYPVDETQTPVYIPRSRWLELLDHLGREVGILIRVPSPLGDIASSATGGPEPAASLTQAAARLRQARDQVRDHRWEEAVQTCRKVLENLAAMDRPAAAKGVLAIVAENRTQEQRWALLFHDLKSLASAAHHDDGTTLDFTWTRAEAEAILASTAAMLARYAAR